MRGIRRRWHGRAKVSGADQAFQSNVGLVFEVVKHQYTLAKAICAKFKSGPISRERVEADLPGRKTGILRQRILCVVLAVIEYELETPIGGQWHRWVDVQVGKIRTTVAVENVFYVSLGRTGGIGAVAFVGLGEIDTGGVLRLILIGDNVALVVITLTD